MSSAIPYKTAIVTGACSGIGLALTRHLLSSQTIRWRVVLADINQESYDKISSSLDPVRTMYQQMDVSSWDDNSRVFKKAFEWPCSENEDAEKRIDFFAANAGTGDTESVLQPFDLDVEPVKPNLTTIQVDLISVLYGLKLFVYYVRKTRTRHSPATRFRPAMVITSSGVGLYGFPAAPQYCTAKHGLVGLTRSIGPPLLANDDLTVNAVLPGLLATQLTLPMVNEYLPQEFITPINTVVRAFDELMNQEDDGDGRVQRKTGQCVEACKDQLYYRQPVAYCDEAMRWLFDDEMNGGVWLKVAAGNSQTK